MSRVLTWKKVPESWEQGWGGRFVGVDLEKDGLWVRSYEEIIKIKLIWMLCAFVF